MTFETLSPVDADATLQADAMLSATPAESAPRAPAARQATVDVVLDAVSRRVAPLWPLDSFVAVNPFLGHAGEDFATAMATIRRVSGATALMPRSWYAAAIAAGRITRADLEAGLAATGSTLAVLDLELAAQAPATPGPAGAATVADIVTEATGTDWTAIAVQEVSKWCAAYFDDGQAGWTMPWRDLPFYAAWRAAIAHDAHPEILGAHDFRAHVERLPAVPAQAVSAALDILGLSGPAAETYLHKALLSVAGWAGHARYRGWSGELAGGTPSNVVEVLAARVSFDVALYLGLTDAASQRAWGAASGRMADPAGAAPAGADVDLVLHEAFEVSVRRVMAARIAAPAAAAEGRPSAQAVFCIDVRSEVLRRALETVEPTVETYGFAGFFGFALEHRPAGAARGVAQCPVLLEPRILACDDAAVDAGRAGALARLRQRLDTSWASFKSAAVSGLAYVEAAGVLAAADLAQRTVGAPARDRDGAAVVPDVLAAAWIGPSAEVRTGLATPERIAAAEGALRAMSLTGPFAPVVLLCGHGSSSDNNPHAAGLDCGACGGHTGEVNARFAAALFNDPSVRVGLAVRGIIIPLETLFVAGLHDTTTDRVTLFAPGGVPASHRDAIASLTAALERASSLTRTERAPRLGLTPAGAQAGMDERATDWSQLRPEWALAGNCAFIAAPRHRTRGVDLGGAAFLHSYDWTKDNGLSVLELIMSAPMVVASWINLQYFGSVTAPELYGSGNKVLHNVVGRIGVLEGAGGDLRGGLAWQSVHDGSRLMHEPARLNVFIEAPQEAIEAVLAKQSGVRDLVENRWVHLHRLDDTGAVFARSRGGVWRAL